MPSEVAVVVGQLSLILTETYEQRYQVINIIRHESYDANLGLNNLAVIEVGLKINHLISCQHYFRILFDYWQTSSPMTFTPDHVDFICYNEDNTTSPEATVMGWGATQVNPTVC